MIPHPPAPFSRLFPLLAQDGGDPITPLLEELLVHSLAPEPTRSHLEKSLHE
jgi:hypothetical protein